MTTNNDWNGTVSSGILNWTPDLQFGGLNTGITYATKVGKYWQLQNVVFIYCQLILSNKGSATGNMTVAGIPIPIFNYSSMNLSYENITFTGTTCKVRAFSSSDLDVVYDNGTGSSGTVLTDVEFANNSSLTIMGYYLIA